MTVAFLPDPRMRRVIHGELNRPTMQDLRVAAAENILKSQQDVLAKALQLQQQQERLSEITKSAALVELASLPSRTRLAVDSVREKQLERIAVSAQALQDAENALNQLTASPSLSNKRISTNLNSRSSTESPSCEDRVSRAVSPVPASDEPSQYGDGVSQKLPPAPVSTSPLPPTPGQAVNCCVIL